MTTLHAHQLDLLALDVGTTSQALGRLVSHAMEVALPADCCYRLLPAPAEGFASALRIDAGDGRNWYPVGQCGEIEGTTLTAAGFAEGVSGLSLRVELEALLALSDSGEPDAGMAAGVFPRNGG